MDPFITDQLPGRTVRTVDGCDNLYFSGTDYLGMGHDEALRRFLNDGFQQYGNHYGSSRNNSLRLTIYEEAERAFAEFVGAQSSLIVSSGIWAGQLLMKEIEQLVRLENQSLNLSYHYAPGVHPALWGNGYVASEMKWAEWAKQTVQLVNNDQSGSAHIICTDAVGSPWVVDCDLSIFSQLSNVGKTWLIADESHALGVKGVNGRGIYHELSASVSANVLVVSSLNKALGIPAGAIYGNEKIVNQLRSSPWFAGASPSPPAFLYAFHMLLQQSSYEALWTKLQHNISYFRKIFAPDKLFASIPDYPVFCSNESALYDHLLKNKIMASCFSYPSATDIPVVRLALNALHQQEDLDRLAEVCMTFLK